MNTQELQRSTRLTPTQQAAREALVRAWVARVLALSAESACSILWAMRAVEEADRTQTQATNGINGKRRLPWKQGRRPSPASE